MNALAKLTGALVGWKGYAVALVVGAIVAGGAAWKAQGWRYDAQLSELRRENAEERADHARATVAAVNAALEEGKRRIAAVEKSRDDATKQAAVAAADAAGARAERDGLRARAYTLARAAVARDPAAADRSPTGAAAVDLLAHMLGRVSDRAEELASIADRARIAGLTCEGAYEGVRAAP